MSNINWSRLARNLPILVLASAAPLAFPAAEKGVGSLHQVGLRVVLPAAALLLAGVAWSYRRGTGTGRLVVRGAAAGALATLALEAVRYPAFRAGFMPGNMPELMGALLFDRFAQGPTLLSTLAGFAFHFWNGASFGIIFAVLADAGILAWKPVPAIGFALLIGLGFLVSPVVQAMGVGIFGLDYGWHFAATVLIAHLAFGTALWGVGSRLAACPVPKVARGPSGNHRGWHPAGTGV